ncbi:MAG: transcription elongation factor GreA, partial [Bacillota bacterium]
MVGKPVLLTQDGLRQLEEELDYLKRTKRREVAQRIKEALAFGDISE